MVAVLFQHTTTGIVSDEDLGEGTHDIEICEGEMGDEGNGHATEAVAPGGFSEPVTDEDLFQTCSTLLGCTYHADDLTWSRDVLNGEGVLSTAVVPGLLPIPVILGQAS